MAHSVIVVAGLGFGDEGKGTIVEHFVHTTGTKLVVRYNGGAQAAHNVVTPDGKHHTFAQFGSGTLLGADTYLGPAVLTEPFCLAAEAKHLESIGVRDPMDGLFVDESAVVITPYHRSANMKDEWGRGNKPHGSTGMGIGVTRQHSIDHPDETVYARDLHDPITLSRKLRTIHDRFVDEGRCSPHSEPADQCAQRMWEIGKEAMIVDRGWLARRLEGPSPTVFEGAQGALLDQVFGFHPHVTYSDTTFGEADRLLDGLNVDVRSVGVTRAYSTRHGAGPLPTERDMGLLEEHNVGGFAGAFRHGPLDLPLLRYALDVMGDVDEIAVTHLDRMATWPVCTRWGFDDLADLSGAGAHRSDCWPTIERQSELAARLMHPAEHHVVQLTTGQLLSKIRSIACARVMVQSWGPTRLDKRTP